MHTGNFRLDVLQQLKKSDFIKLLNHGLEPVAQRQRFKKSHSVHDLQAREIRKIHHKFSLHKKQYESKTNVVDYLGTSPHLIKQMKNKMLSSTMKPMDEPITLKIH